MKDWRITNISLRPADSPRIKPSPRKEYKHDPNCKAVTSPFFSDLLKNKVYYLGIESRHDDIYRCYIWYSPELEMVTFDNESYMKEYLNDCKKLRMYHRWGVLTVVIDGVVSECENENYDCYSRMEYRSLPRNYVLSLTLS